MNTQRREALGALVKKYRGPMTQTAVAELLSRHLGEPVRQGIVSDHEKGNRWSDEKWQRAYIDVLHIPEDEMIAALGYTMPGIERPKTFREIVEADPSLSKAAKEHLINQYGLLQLASRHAPATNDEGDLSLEAESRRHSTSA